VLDRVAVDLGELVDVVTLVPALEEARKRSTCRPASLK
jgi:hypothetical protein